MENNVKEFVVRCATKIAEHEENDLRDWIGAYNMESPIEQVLYCALRTLRQILSLEYQATTEVYKDSEVPISIYGVDIDPQKKIGSYYVDFMVSFNYVTTELITESVIVECDSQQFHERTEKERRYEKKRDRYFTSQGYKVLHYTGKEILEHPFDIAREILTFIIPGMRG